MKTVKTQKEFHELKGVLLALLQTGKRWTYEALMLKTGVFEQDIDCALSELRQSGLQVQGTSLMVWMGK
jgi:hypothetical protein